MAKSKENIVNKEEKKEEFNIFEQELSKIPQEFGEDLKKAEKKIKDIVEEIEKLTQGKSIGFYLTPEIENKDNTFKPNFKKLTLNFMLDDFERPIVQFSPEILLGNKFNKYLKKEVKKNDHSNEEEVIYYLKNNKNIKFSGTSVTLFREDCFDSNYEILKILSNSVVYKDPRNLLMALKTIEIHKNMVLQKFEKYVVVNAGVGSWIRGEKSNDFDVFFVIDDTDVKRLPRYQVKEQLTKIIYDMAFQVAELTGIKLHIQTYLLTDFWDNLKDAHPVIFTFLRDGVPFYDRGLFNSWKELLKLGKIKPSPEAIDMHMNIGNQLINNARSKLKDILMSDIYNAVLSPSQAILMLKGFNPTTPKETVKLFKEVLLEKEGIITEKEYKTLEKVRELFKKAEHDEKLEIDGREIEKLLKEADKFLNKIKKIFEMINEERTKESILTMYNDVLANLKELGLNIKSDKLLKDFEEFSKERNLPSFTIKSLKQIIKAKSDYDNKKITSSEVNKALKEGRQLLTELRNLKENEILKTEKKIKIDIKANDKIVSLYRSNNQIFLIDENNVYKLNNNEFEIIDRVEFEKLNKDLFNEIKINENLFKALKDYLGTEDFSLIR